MIIPIINRLGAWRTADLAHPWVRRCAVPALCALLGVPSIVNPANDAPWWIHVLLMTAFCVPLLWRESRPATVFAFTTGVSALSQALVVFNGADAARAVALYSVGRHGTPRQLVVAVSVTMLQLLAWAAVFWTSGQLEYVSRPEVAALLAMAAMAAFAGLGLAGRLVNTVIAALQKERDQQAQLAAAAERARVAREMHDILGHTLAVIVGLADGAAALAATRPERGAETLRIIGESGRDALGELRRLLAVVDVDGAPRGEAPLAPQPGARDLDALLDRVRAAGPSARLRTEGQLDALSPGLQLAVYRIVQEALTNTLKHAAPDTDVSVTVTAGADAVLVAVEDTGPSLAGASRGRAGQGLVGMRERAALYQGEVTAGPNSRGGWAVRARLLPTTTHPENHHP
ncbi:two-component sensor histidine kinase [Streptomyces roseirectus]|uniref:histidine kinase n=1 Tax=Streptomyces roseirectus TaxID=2768066 RepID=A0A7H0IS84_9ACTN|nr:two-component sensor histidine kinase [Streptomyces roseirectus]